MYFFFFGPFSSIFSSKLSERSDETQISSNINVRELTSDYTHLRQKLRNTQLICIAMKLRDYQLGTQQEVRVKYRETVVKIKRVDRYEIMNG